MMSSYQFLVCRLEAKIKQAYKAAVSGWNYD